MKRTCLFVITSILLLSAVSALAEAPSSQFGFRGWPYRQTTAPCGAAISAPAATKSPTATKAPASTPRPTAVPTAKPTAKPTSTPISSGDYTTESTTMQEQKLLNLLNHDRAANGLPALTLDSELSRIARMKSCDMKQNGYFAHESPTYGNAASMLTRFGYSFAGVGENIAHHASVEKAEAAFMSSTGHRANILGSQWTKVGIGICIDNNGFVYVTQLLVR